MLRKKILFIIFIGLVLLGIKWIIDAKSTTIDLINGQLGIQLKEPDEYNIMIIHMTFMENTKPYWY